MKHQTALIIIDSGFSQQALERAGKVLAVWDLSRDMKFEGDPYVPPEQLAQFAGDRLHHGTIVLERLMDRVPELPVILIRVMPEKDDFFIRTSWNERGEIDQPGWTEAYLWAVDLCRRRGFRSVANCSFGAFIHASDGTGWEAHQVSQATGAGKPNHIMVVAAGVGDGRAQHASWRHLTGETIPVTAYQKGDAKYNLWSGHEKGALWRLSVKLNGDEQFVVESSHVPKNMWNDRKQHTFTVHGEGYVEFVMELFASGTADDGINEGALRFDIWAPSDMTASFLNRIDQELISEPACFRECIAVGLRRGIYAANQTELGAKPEVLVPGGEQISFRTPEVTAAVARLLRDTAADLDVDDVRKLLGKYPQLS